MYADPTHIRDNPIKVRLNDVERDAVEALAKLNQMQTAVFVRELLLEGIEMLRERSKESRAA